ncbi:hypothetical protein KIPB_012076, partial [Kipferlia bialata]|eukprot:g12076.t1
MTKLAPWAVVPFRPLTVCKSPSTEAAYTNCVFLNASDLQ